MPSRIAEQSRYTIFRDNISRTSGQPRSVLWFSSEREIETMPDFSKLPVVANSGALQDSEGNFYFLVGYSAIGGGDIIP